MKKLGAEQLRKIVDGLTMTRASIEKMCAVFRKNRCGNKEIERRFESDMTAAALEPADSLGEQFKKSI
jgi:phage-related minor tail protein